MIVFNGHTSGLTQVHYQGHSIKEVHNALGKVWPEEVPPTPPTPTGYSAQYFTIVAQESGRITPKHNGTLSYSLDSGATWVEMIGSYASVNVNSSDVIMWKGNLSQDEGNNNFGSFLVNCSFYVEGNIMSLLYGDNFASQTSLIGYQDVFFSLFSSSEEKLKNIDNLVLPATTLSPYCYHHMFADCTNLKTVPSDLLLATTLAVGCYNDMFQGCTNLKKAPDLLAATLVGSCYDMMFEGCTNLKYVKCLATDISATNCTRRWLYNVSSSGTFVKAASMNDWTTGNSGIPNGWTVVDNT